MQEGATWTDSIQDMPEQQAERAVIAAILTDPESVVIAMENLNQEHFADPFLGEAFRQSVLMFERGEVPDVVTLAGVLRDAGYKTADNDILSIAGWSFSANIMPSFMPAYANRVRRMSRVREFQSALPKKLGQLLKNPTLDPSDILSEWLSETESDYRSDDPGPRRLDTMMTDIGVLLDGKRDGTIVNEQTMTPWDSLTKVLGGGIKPGEVCVVAGRPGSGKTVVGAQMLFEASMYGTAIMFSAEMTYDMVVQRMIACETGISFHKINDPQLMNDEEYDLARSYMDSLSALPVYIDDLTGVTTAQMMSRTQQLQREGTVSLLVFDYLELAGDTTVDRKNQEAWISDVIRSLKIVARRLKIPVVVLAQLSREVERRNPPIPKLSDLRMSGMIEQVADKVIMLYRPQYYVQQGMLEPDPELEHLLEVYIHKNRNGASGKVALRYDGPLFRVSEIQEQPVYGQGAML